MHRSIVIYGAGGHSRVVLDAARASGMAIDVLVDDNPLHTEVSGIRVRRSSDPVLNSFRGTRFIVAIGDNSQRALIYNRLRSVAEPVNVIHPFSCISTNARLGAGIAVMAGVVVNADSLIGDNVILNTSCSVDHDCSIDSHVHICPGVHLAGGVTVGRGTLIGTGSSVVPGVKIGSNCVIGAGSLVRSAVPENSLAFGSPAHFIRPREFVRHFWEP